MKQLPILIVSVLLLASCSTNPTTEYCEQAEFLKYVSYNGEVNRAYFQTDDRSYYIHLDPETGLLLREGQVYTLCFDEDNNFKFLQEP